MTLRVAVIGAKGRMGRAVADVLREANDAELALAVDRDAGDGVVAIDALAAHQDSLDIAIDFTHASSARAVFSACKEATLALVTGTTGVEGDGEQALQELTSVAPVVAAPNMSVGVNVLFHVAKVAAELAGESFDAEISEMHHRYKTDAPSGTAVRLAEVVRRAKGFSPAAIVHGRSGQVGARPREEIGVMTLRGGSVIGDHTLMLAGPNEVLQLTHRAGDRSIFARGAVRAALWAADKKPGLYSMADVLGLSA